MRAMTISKIKISVVVHFSLRFSVSAFCQESEQRNTDKSCQQFVGRFYNWYVGTALRQNRLTQPRLVLKSGPHLFSHDLLQALREDYEAQDKAGSELVSLDADPFVGGDGPPDRYIVEKVTVKDGRCWVELDGVWEGKKSETPDVTPELIFKRGRWIFTNFYFPKPFSRQGLESS